MQGKSEKLAQMSQEKRQSLMKIPRFYPLFVAILSLFAAKRAFQLVVLRPKRLLRLDNYI